ncbi:MAG: glycosyltransferase family 4 protein [Planctomycetota bacterium]|nr:glycosyltransferase family 4 protein [Planctomycetota bacterium]
MAASPEDSLSFPVSATGSIRVAWVTGHGALLRHGRTFQMMAIGLIDEMTEVLVLCPPEVDAGALPAPVIQVVRYRYNPWLPWRRRRGLVQELARRDIGLLHCVEGEALSVTRHLAGAAGLPLVVSCYSLQEALALGPDPRQHGMLAASEPIARALTGRYRTESVFLVRPGVFLTGAGRSPRPEGRRVAIMAGGGRFDDARAFEGLLKAFHLVRQRRGDCLFFLMGSGPAEHAIRRRAAALELLGDLTFIDYAGPAQLPAVFKAADMYVSLRAGGEVDLASLQAMAAGVPVVAAGEGGSDFLVDGQTARFFRGDDGEDLAGKIVGLLDAPEAAATLVRGAAALLEKQHSPAAMIGQLVRIYRHVLGDVARGKLSGGDTK